MSELPVTRLRPRQVGALKVVSLDDRLGVLVEFVVPSAMLELEIDAATEAAYAAIKRMPSILARYGLGDGTLTEEQASVTFSRIRLQEAAVILWKRWNVSYSDDGEAEPINADTVRELLVDTNIRTIWSIFLSQACSLDPLEGNVSAASPGTSTGEAATTAEDAPESTSPAPEASPTGQSKSSARKSRTRRKPPKASSSDA